MIRLLAHQEELRRELPKVVGNADYDVYQTTLERMEELIELGRIDELAMRCVVEEAQKRLEEAAKTRGDKLKELSGQVIQQLQQTARQAMRIGVARHVTGESFRVFSRHLAESALLQSFCLIDRLDVIKVPSKSTVERYEKLLPEEVLDGTIGKLLRDAGIEADEEGVQALHLKEAISLDDYYVDTTCVKANIHFPVDWVLLRDATRTLMKAVKLIRKAGLKNRMMEEPGEFIGQMNKLSIKMTQTRRKEKGKRKRKRIYREMKKLMKKISKHAEKHMELLDTRWEETELSEKQKDQIKGRLEGVLEQLPQAIHEAQERIIGGRQVKSSEKVLSLYERDIHVIVRGKAGAEVEFGNVLFLGEQADGVIIDWKLYEDRGPGDSKMLPESLERLKRRYGEKCRPKSVTTDRGFYSGLNKLDLSNAGIDDFTCPRSPKELAARLEEEGFCDHQRRRAQTEGRIGILKNNFLGRPLRSKGFVHRELNVGWGILTHNLWVIARLPKAEAGETELRQAA